MAPTRELSIETMERIIRLLRERNPTRSVPQYVGCSQSAVSKIWCKYKQNGKRMGWPRNMSKRQDGKLKAIWLENRKQMGRNRSQCLWQNCKKSSEWNGINIQKSQTKTSNNTKERKQGYSGLKRSSHGDDAGTLSGAVLMKPMKMTAWRKQSHFPSPLW